MQKLIDTLKSFGIEIPEDKQADVKKALSEHYKNAKEVAKTLSKVEGERDDWKERAETAEETLKGFEGIDPANIQTELAGWKKKAEDAEKEFNAKIYERDFDDALKTALENVNFSSPAAKRSVTADIKSAGLKLKEFTFHNVSINTNNLKNIICAALIFTFHNVSINTTL